MAALGGGGALSLEPLTASALSRALPGAAVTLLAAPVHGRSAAEASLGAGVPVVSASDDPHEARSLLMLDDEARRRDLPVVVGACMVPGLSCLLAAWAAELMDDVTEVHVASLGTGGPACARRHHAALREGVEEWRDGVAVRRVAGSGRELVWFPEYAGADCYRVNRPDPLLLARAFPGLRSATTRAAASRSRPFHVLVADAAPAAPGGDRRCPQSRGTGPAGGGGGDGRGGVQRPAGAAGRSGGRGCGREGSRWPAASRRRRAGLIGQRSRRVLVGTVRPGCAPHDLR